MYIAGSEEVIFTRAQQRLLGGWRDIIDDIRRLCRSLQALPDVCTCGHGSEHLSGSCACCHGVHDRQVPKCDDCNQLLTRLRPALDTLVVDTVRFSPVVRDLLDSHAADAVRAEGASVEHDIAAIYSLFGRLIVAAEEFRSGCRASHLHAVKAQAEALAAEVRRLDRKLQGPEP